MTHRNLFRQQALGANLAASATLTGSTFDTGGSATPWHEFGAFFLSNGASASNGAQLQISQDGVTWKVVRQATLSAGVPQELSTPILARYHRAVLINDATADTDVTVVDYARIV